MHLVSTKKPTERGDTLVEVLIAIAVISLILGGAFVLTNRSLQGTREAQERVNALKLVESQLEQIKNLATTDSDKLFGPGALASYCISGGVPVISSNAACAVGVDNAPTTIEPVFHLSITRSGNIFTVRNTWTSIRGDVQNNIEMKYKVYE